MKTLNLLQYFVVLVLLVSCGSDKKDKEQDKKSGSKDVVELIVEYKSAFNDKFEVFYTVTPGETIKGDYKLVSYVYGSDDMQKIVFEFPSGELPYTIRLDVGENQMADQITIKNISVKYKGKLIDGDSGKFMDYFNLYETIKYNKERFIYEFIPVDGKKDPFIYSNEYMDSSLVDLYN